MRMLYESASAQNEIKMERNGLRVIKGGKPLTFSDIQRKFKWAYVTNTRLMGVVFLCVCWEEDESEFYQLFYFDAEEFGLDTYQSFHGKSKDLEEAIDSMSGGLGGINIDITEDEARQLISSFIKYNLERHIEMPGREEEYLHYYDIHLEVSPKTFGKMCEEITTSYQLVNYYVMRLLGKDFEAADFLTDGFSSVDHYPEIKGATLCKSTVDPIEGEAGSFMVECVLDVDNGFHSILTCQVDTKCQKNEDGQIMDYKVTGFKPISKFRITPEETALKLGRSEFITLVHFLGDADEFTKEVSPLLKRAMVTEHEKGKVYMIFNPDNSHVNKKVFQLNGDVYGTFYVTNFNHILISSFNEETVAALEKELGASYLGSKCRVRKRYEFTNPVLFMFIESGMTDFKEFVSIIEDE